MFSAVRGLETYSTRFYLDWTDRAGQRQSLQLTPEVYARVRGPYNRRNVYGAVLAYGPVLATDERTRPLFEAVSRTALNGHSLSYVDIGSGSALIFLHGLLGSHRHRGSSLTDLARTHRVIAPDLFGHGASAKLMGDYSLGAHAATVRDLMDRLEIETVTVVGHSLGGGIALQFAYLFPGRAERLVLVSSGGLGRELGLSLRAATLPG